MPSATGLGHTGSVTVPTFRARNSRLWLLQQHVSNPCLTKTTTTLRCVSREVLWECLPEVPSAVLLVCTGLEPPALQKMGISWGGPPVNAGPAKGIAESSQLTQVVRPLGAGVRPGCARGSFTHSVWSLHDADL